MNESTDFNEIKGFYLLFEKVIKTNDIPNILKILANLPSLEESFLKNYQKRKKEGVYYTTDKLSYFIVLEVIFLLLKSRISLPNINDIQEIHKLNSKQRTEVLDLLLNTSIYDPACGSGIFLLNAAKIRYNLIKVLNPSSDISKIKTQILSNIYGQDINDNAIRFCILKLYNWYFEEKNTHSTHVISKLKTNLKVGNSLKSSIHLNFDLVVGNPPYGNILSKEEKLILKREKI